MPEEVFFHDEINLQKISQEYPLFGSLFEVLQCRTEEFVRLFLPTDCRVAFVYYGHFVAGVRPEPNGGHCLFMDAMVPIQLTYCFRRLLSHPETLKELAASGAAFSRPGLVLFGSKEEIFVKGPIEDTVELCDLRSSAVTVLLVQAIRLLYMHEVGHVIGGHIEYRDRVGPVEEKIRRGLEHLADRDAIEGCMVATILHPTPAQEDELKRIEFILLGFAAGVLWELLGAYAASGAVSAYYPTAGVRRMVCEGLMATSQLREELQRLLPALGKEDFLRGLDEGRDAWERIGWPPDRWPTVEETNRAMHDVGLAESALAANRQ